MSIAQKLHRRNNEPEWHDWSTPHATSRESARRVMQMQMDSSHLQAWRLDLVRASSAAMYNAAAGRIFIRSLSRSIHPHCLQNDSTKAASAPAFRESDTGASSHSRNDGTRRGNTSLSYLFEDTYLSMVLSVGS